MKSRDGGNFVNVLLDTMENAVHARHTDMIKIEHRITTDRKMKFFVSFPKLYSSY